MTLSVHPAVEQQCAFDHLLACCAHERELERLRVAFVAANDPRLNAAWGGVRQIQQTLN